MNTDQTTCQNCKRLESELTLANNDREGLRSILAQEMDQNQTKTKQLAELTAELETARRERDEVRAVTVDDPETVYAEAASLRSELEQARREIDGKNAVIDAIKSISEGLRESACRDAQTISSLRAELAAVNDAIQRSGMGKMQCSNGLFIAYRPEVDEEHNRKTTEVINENIELSISRDTLRADNERLTAECERLRGALERETDVSGRFFRYMKPMMTRDEIARWDEEFAARAALTQTDAAKALHVSAASGLQYRNKGAAGDCADNCPACAQTDAAKG